MVAVGLGVAVGAAVGAAVEVAVEVGLEVAVALEVRRNALGPAECDEGAMGRLDHVIFPRRRGQSDYAANAAMWDRNSNSIGLT